MEPALEGTWVTTESILGLVNLATCDDVLGSDQLTTFIPIHAPFMHQDGDKYIHLYTYTFTYTFSDIYIYIFVRALSCSIV